MENSTRFPELIVGIAGPIGVEMDSITEGIQAALDDVNYKTEVIKLTSAMLSYEVSIKDPGDIDFCSIMNYKMDYADKLREEKQDLSFLSSVAIKAIVERRKLITGDVAKPSPSTAYIIRQFKRPEEIHLMRRVYGKHFILVSAYGSAGERKSILEGKQKNPARLRAYRASPRRKSTD